MHFLNELIVYLGGPQKLRVTDFADLDENQALHSMNAETYSMTSDTSSIINEN